MDIPTYSFEFGGVAFVTEQETGWSVPDCQLICNKLIMVGAYNPTNERQRNRAVRFAEAITQTTSAKTVDPAQTLVECLSFEWPVPESSAECLAEAFVGFGKRKGLMTAFFSALQEVEKLTPADPFLAKTPPQEPTSDNPLTSGLAAGEPPPKS